MKTGREERTSDFRRRASVEMGGSYIRRALWRSVARSLKSEVTNRGSGTLAASALARHCEATGVSLPRGGVSHGNAWVVYSNSDCSYASLTLLEFEAWRKTHGDCPRGAYGTHTMPSAGSSPGPAGAPASSATASRRSISIPKPASTTTATASTIQA